MSPASQLMASIWSWLPVMLETDKIINNMNTPKAQPANVKVFCRFRPLNKQEQEAGNNHPIQNIISDQHLAIKDPSKGDDLTFVFDKIYNTATTQEQIYNEVAAPILENILDGFNGTIIAYGQTSSGKTYTIQGNSHDSLQKGIIPRIIQQLFIAIEGSPACIEYKLKVSILELYMEKLYDLIDSQKTDLKIRESKTDGNYVQGKTQAYISDKYQLLRLMNLAQKNRITCVTNMNANSSRSHLIFHLTLNQFNSETEQAKVSNLFIVDLAGSEKVSKTGAEGKILQQAKKINLSLTCLAKVIKSLSEKIQHVPYRDSKLTRIIQDSLGGNSKTTLILTCSPHESNVSETISTLRFGQTAQKIKNKPKINREPTIQQLQKIIIRLQGKIKVKDHQIMMLESHIRNKYNGNVPKYEDLKKYEGTLKAQRMYSTVDLNCGSPSINQPEEDENLLQSSFETNFDKYLLATSVDLASNYKIPQLEMKIDPEQTPLSECQLYNYDQRIATLQNQLTVCRNRLVAQNGKLSTLQKEFNEVNQAMRVVAQENIVYKIRQAELQQILRGMGCRDEQLITKLAQQNTIPQLTETIKIKQQNQLLLKLCQSSKVQKQLLESKLKHKECRIKQLKSMMQQIQEQMQLMSQQYDEPINFNTKIANPIKRSIICE